jgi:AraC-like DNA-binding protein
MDSLHANVVGVKVGGLRLTVYRPTGRLAEYVHQFQVLSTDEGTDTALLDFGGAEVSVPLRFGDPIRVEEPAPAEVQSATLVGPWTRSVWLRFTGRIDQVNISLFPGVAGAFVGVQMTDLVGRMAPPEDVWPRDFREAVAELEPLPVEERISRLEALLLARLDPRRGAGEQVREAVRLINNRRGRVQVHWLADQVNLSVSQLERDFKQHVGIGPKLLARQTRASEVARHVMQSRSVDWAQLAYGYGFSDQAHLVREFGQFMGLTPSAFGRIGADADFLQDAVSLPIRN